MQLVLKSETSQSPFLSRHQQVSAILNETFLVAYASFMNSLSTSNTAVAIQHSNISKRFLD